MMRREHTARAMVTVSMLTDEEVAGIAHTDLNAEGIRALAKCDAAERFTTVPGRVRSVVYLALQESGLLCWDNGLRLTAQGRRVLAAACAG
jgi:hypothetical protein